VIIPGGTFLKGNMYFKNVIDESKSN
jgi:hypothetical protein